MTRKRVLQFRHTIAIGEIKLLSQQVEQQRSQLDLAEAQLSAQDEIIMELQRDKAMLVADLTDQLRIVQALRDSAHAGLDQALDELSKKAI